MDSLPPPGEPGKADQVNALDATRRAAEQLGVESLPVADLTAEDLSRTSLLHRAFSRAGHTGRP